MDKDNVDKLVKTLKNFKSSNLGTYPTPIHRLDNYQKKYNHKDIWIKRDDLTGLALGGNKVRSLEYILGEALLQKADTVLVGGPPQSNMCLIAAAASKKLGMDCITVHNGNASKKLEGNELLLSLLNVESRFIGEKDEFQREDFVIKTSKELEEKGKKTFIIKKGGSTALGALGYIEAAVEVYRQIEGKGLNIKHVFMPAGNGGTVAGLIIGANLLNMPFHVHAISVEYPKADLVKIIADFAKEVEELLGIKLPHAIEESSTIYEEYMGKGWGENTKESEAMVYEFPETEGIFLENVYTSKVMVGMLDLIKKGKIPLDEGVCYWHTGGISSLFAQL